MGKIISVNIQKGGCGKSTTTQAIASCLSKRNYKCLLVDLDPQGNLSYSSGTEGAEKTTYEFLKGESTFDETVIHTSEYDIISANILLSGADQEFTKTGREYILKDQLDEVKDRYDFVILDTPPSLGILSVNSLTASDYVIIPTEPSFYAMQGLGQLNDTIESVKKYCNRDLKILGLLLIKFNDRTILNRQIKEMLESSAELMKTKVFNTYIREGVAVREAQAMQKSLIEYAPQSNPCIDYNSFADELLKEIG